MTSTINFDLKAGIAILTQDDRWNVLTVLILHANRRGRAWPTTETIAGMGTNGNLNKAVSAKKWLIEHQALVLVPYRKRVGEECNLPRRQHIYQLTGYFLYESKLYPYLYLNDVDRAEIVKELERLAKSEVMTIDNFAIENFNGEIMNGSNGSSSILSSSRKSSLKDSSPAKKSAGADDRKASSKSTGQSKPNPAQAGLLKTKFYPVNGAIYDDPFHDSQSFAAAQTKGHYDGCELVLGRNLMDLPEYCNMDVEEVEKRVGYKKTRHRTAPSVEADPMYHLIAELWELPVEVVGRIYQLRHFLTGTAKKGEWGDFAIDPPMTVQELEAYVEWRDRQGRGDLNMPEQPEQIQKSVWEFRYDPAYSAFMRRFADDPTPEPPSDQPPKVVPANPHSFQPNYQIHTMPPHLRDHWLREHGFETMEAYQMALNGG